MIQGVLARVGQEDRGTLRLFKRVVRVANAENAVPILRKLQEIIFMQEEQV